MLAEILFLFASIQPHKQITVLILYVFRVGLAVVSYIVLQWHLGNQMIGQV